MLQLGQDITITVSPHSVASGAQQAYLRFTTLSVRRRIVCSRNGDEPAGRVFLFLRVEGVTSNFDTEILPRRGKTYRHLGKLDAGRDAAKPYQQTVKVTPRRYEAL